METAKGLHFPSAVFAPINRDGALSAHSEWFFARDGQKAITRLDAHEVNAGSIRSASSSGDGRSTICMSIARELAFMSMSRSLNHRQPSAGISYFYLITYT
jgi:hypothetical protein